MVDSFDHVTMAISPDGNRALLTNLDDSGPEVVVVTRDDLAAGRYRPVRLRLGADGFGAEITAWHGNDRVLLASRGSDVSITPPYLGDTADGQCQQLRPPNTPDPNWLVIQHPGDD